MKKSSLDNIVQSILEYISEQLPKKGRLLVAIDGRCAAGKTSIATRLQEECDLNLIHMDDFFLRPEQRTEDRLREPGGNVDYERFEKEVLKPLTEDVSFAYAPFDCQTLQLKEKISVEPKSVTIVEGSYSCHPYLQKYYDIKIFLSVKKEEQRERILRRNGEDSLKVFVEKWIPLEEYYFEIYPIKDECDMQFLT